MARRITLLEFSHLAGWAEDDHVAAIEVFLATAAALPGPAWADAVKALRGATSGEARDFLERTLRPVLIEDGTPALFTGYYEPELDGVLSPDEAHSVPLYARPPEAPLGAPWLSRADIEAGALAGRGLELAWVADPVDAFFLQVQGSGRIRLDNRKLLRLGYAGGNGQPYTSVGRALIERGAVSAEAASAEDVKAWLRAHPAEGAAVMRLNASFVFFRELEDLSPKLGPIGTSGCPVTALRTLAVDSEVVPLGAPVWIETTGPDPLRRLMIAQDTGSAIRGAQRADIYFGTGPAAGERAGRVRDGGRMVLLLPLALAEMLAAETAP